MILFHADSDYTSGDTKIDWKPFAKAKRAPPVTIAITTS